MIDKNTSILIYGLKSGSAFLSSGPPSATVAAVLIPPSFAVPPTPGAGFPGPAALERPLSAKSFSPFYIFLYGFRVERNRTIDLPRIRSLSIVTGVTWIRGGTLWSAVCHGLGRK